MGHCVDWFCLGYHALEESLHSSVTLGFFFVPLKDLLATWSIPVLLALKGSSLHSPHQLL